MTAQNLSRKNKIIDIFTSVSISEEYFDYDHYYEQSQASHHAPLPFLACFENLATSVITLEYAC